MATSNSTALTLNDTSEQPTNFPLSITSGIIGTVMTVLSFTGQVLVFIVFYKESRLQTPTNYYVVSLALADFLISAISMPVWTITTTLNYWPMSQLICDLWNSLDAALCNISMHTILFISVERYRSVKDPIGYKANLTPKRMILCLVGIWVGEFVVWTSFLFVTQYIYGKVRDPLGCQVFWLNERALAVALGMMTFVLPISITAIIYGMIYRIAKRSGALDGKFHRRTRRRGAEGSTGPTVSTSLDSGSESTLDTVTGQLEHSQQPTKSTDKKDVTSKIQMRRHGAKTANEDKKALKTIALLLVTFAVCWLPLGVVFIMMGIIPERVDVFWIVLGFWLGYANSMVNPLCYSIGNPNFRHTLVRIMCTCRNSSK